VIGILLISKQLQTREKEKRIEALEGPNGIVEDDQRMFQDFHTGDLDLTRLNFALLTLIPKELGGRSMKKYRQISLCNCSFKIFSKVLTIRLGKIADRLISTQQSAFIGGRYILKSVVVVVK
jgi:hypothetical protein